jgi:hypothetical protein
MTAFELIGALREQFIEQLQGPGVTWNLKGIEMQFEKAVAYVALKNLDPK